MMPASPESLPCLNPEDYLAYEREQQIRYELVDGYLYAMTGASDRHEGIALNPAAALRVHLRGSQVRVTEYSRNLRVDTASTRELTNAFS